MNKAELEERLVRATKEITCGNCGKILLALNSVKTHKCKPFNQFAYRQYTIISIFILIAFSMLITSIETFWINLIAWVISWIIFYKTDLIIRRWLK